MISEEGHPQEEPSERAFPHVRGSSRNASSGVFHPQEARRPSSHTPSFLPDLTKSNPRLSRRAHQLSTHRGRSSTSLGRPKPAMGGTPSSRSTTPDETHWTPHNNRAFTSAIAFQTPQNWDDWPPLPITELHKQSWQDHLASDLFDTPYRLPKSAVGRLHLISMIVRVWRPCGRRWCSLQ
ncbi:hypothetical protein CYMTET_29302 [Cymbomonas tetramitiformis]|uniref:Uncharacterized protein n=1 Tax=Cymbomonas tetramitiformis TaxID=36881 RepID=A0AAE0FLB8_9CHLO|nr:hypothetical protein CYMTET_29302 [Cymbomonas tetramitiformis]